MMESMGDRVVAAGLPRPARDHVLVKRMQSEGVSDVGGFVLPKDYHQKPMRCTVVDVGDEHWEWRKPNGEVLLPKRGSTKVECEGGEYHLCHVKDIIGVM